MTHQLNWEDLKTEMEQISQDCIQRGSEYCPCCLTHMGQLIKDLDWLFKQRERDADDLIKRLNGRTLQ